MIQLNLLPDVKLEYIKAQRVRRLVTSVCFIITAVAVVILILLVGVDLAQKKHLSDVKRDVASETSTLEGKTDITQILTVQNQLQSLTALHEGKPAADRLFSSYINQITPANVSLSDLQVDFNMHTMIITGTADSLSTVNQYVDTMKFTKYTINNSTTSTSAFSNVVLASFGINQGSQNSAQAASFTINLSYDPTIFDITKNITLSVPSIVTTRSELEQPTNLFTAAPTSSTGGQ